MAGNGNEKLKILGQPELLDDGSMAWAGYDRPQLLRAVEEDKPFTSLRHPEVRYEVTDHCNAVCIMCPRDKHENGRPHGIMDLEKYKRSIDEIVALGAKKIVLTGFGEPLIDRTLEQKIAYAKSKNPNTYIITNGSLITRAGAKTLIEASQDDIRGIVFGLGPETYNGGTDTFD